MVHGSIAIPGKTERDEVVITTDEIAATGLDYLALGHWHSAQHGKAGDVTYAYAGAPEAVALDQDRAGKVLLVELEERTGDDGHGRRSARSARRGSRRSSSTPATIAGPAGPHRDHSEKADPDLVLDVRLVGVRPDELDLDLDEIEAALAPSFLKVRVRDVSVPALTEGALPSPDTIAGAFIRDLEARIAELEARRGSGAEANGRGGGAARRPAPRAPAARRPRGLAVRIRRLQVRDLRRYRELDIDLAPGVTVIRGPERGRQVDHPARHRARDHAPGDEQGRGPRGAPAVGEPDARGAWIAIEFEQDEEDGRKATGTSRRRSPGQGHGQARLRRAGRSPTRPSPTRSWPS